MAVIDFSKRVLVDPAFLSDLEAQELFVFDMAPRYAYEDGKRTDKVAGTTVILQVVRSATNPLSNLQLTVITDQVLERDQWLDEDVHLTVDRDATKVWARSSKGTTFAQVEVSLHGHLTLAGGADVGDLAK